MKAKNSEQGIVDREQFNCNLEPVNCTLIYGAKKYSTLRHTVNALVGNTEEGRIRLR